MGIRWLRSALWLCDAPAPAGVIDSLDPCCRVLLRSTASPADVNLPCLPVLVSAGMARQAERAPFRLWLILIPYYLIIQQIGIIRYSWLSARICESVAVRMFPAGPAMFYPVYRASRRHGCVQLLLWIWRIRLASAAASIIPCMPAPLRPGDSISCVRQVRTV